MEAFPREVSPYALVNSALRAEGADRAHKLKPFLGYIKLLMWSLQKLPRLHAPRTLYRGISGAHVYSVEAVIPWMSFSSCTTDAATTEQFLGKGPRPFICIDAISGTDISEFNHLEPSEVLLPPGMLLRVKGCAKLPGVPDMIIVNLQVW
mmetsp:Transcript_25033/g.54238  ORF Transcript_25033/g.54238 Transcript_25033/m.54238 type:complete len:150 (-) Transcript_25033:1148-1597(-)